MNSKKTISEFLSSEYKEFAMYTIENRAIPSLVDSFKNSQRKIIHTSNQIWKTGSEKTLKVFQLSGKVASDCYYHHGNTSLENTIVTMAQKFKNNVPFLEEDGQFGSLRSPQASASRYIGTKLSSNFRMIYKDFDLLEYKYEEGDKIEPYYFLPIIPTILLNGTSGIAVGFSNNILPRKIDDIIDNCISYLSGKKLKSMTPYINVFNGSIEIDKNNNKRWILSGIYEKVNNNTLRIKELPPSYTYEKYEELLDKLIEDRIIVSYEDNSKDNIDYIIKSKNINSLDLVKTFKLEEYSTEMFTTLDENGKLKIFDSDLEIVEYFIKFRLTFYKKRKEKMIKRLESDLIILSNKAKFIKAVLENKIIISNKNKDDIFKQIEKHNIEKIENSYDYLLRLQLYSLTKEVYDRLLSDFGLKTEELEKIKKYDENQMYIDDLKNLKKEIKKIS
jgi:DNA topoisomerase-2